MASKYFLGTATAVAQVDRFTPANVGVGDVFTLTATGEDGTTAAVSFTAAAATVASVTAGLVAAWAASANPLHTALTAADATTSLTLTARTAGVPFSVAPTTTDGNATNTQTLSRSVVTANSGPSDWNTALNWSDAAVPVNSDSVTLDARMAVAVLYGLNQSAVTLAALTLVKGCKSVGSVGATSAALRVSATLADVNKPPTDGSNPSAATTIVLDFGTNATTCSVWGSNNTGTSGVEPVCIKGAHASNVLRVYDGTVGVATLKPGDTANFPVVYAAGAQTKVILSSGCSTVTTLTSDRAAVVLRAAATTVTTDGGTLTTEGSGAITTANINGAAFLNSTGTLATLNIEAAGNVDTTQTPAARTITTTSVFGGGRLKSDLNTTYTNGVYLYRGATSAQVAFPDGTKLVPSAAP